MKDPMGMLVSEARTANIASGRVRAGEPAPGDALGPGSYQRFVVLVRLGTERIRRAPVQIVRVAARCYGVTYQDASALYGELSDLFHLAGGRGGSGGRWIYQSIDDIGGSASKDPETDQPYEEAIFEIVAST